MPVPVTTSFKRLFSPLTKQTRNAGTILQKVTVHLMVTFSKFSMSLAKGLDISQICYIKGGHKGLSEIEVDWKRFDVAHVHTR